MEADCGKESGDAAGKGCGDPGKTKPDGPTEKEPGKQAFPSEAGHDFEAAAVKAVKQWKYRPGNMNGVPVDVYYTIIIDFTSCPKRPEKDAP